MYKKLLLAVTFLCLFSTQSILSQTNCLAFNRTGSNYVSVPASGDWNFGTGNFTVEWWQFQTVDNITQRIFTINGKSFAVSIEDFVSNKTFFCWVGNGLAFYTTISSYMNTWVHFAITRSGSTVTLYMNGVSKGTGTSSSSAGDGSSTLYIGSEAFNATFFGGKLEEMRFWNIARSQAEIQAKMNTSLAGNETGLVAYYKFDQGTAGGTNTGITTLTDNTGHGHTGTLTNFTLTGSTSNWVSSSVALPVELTSFTAEIAVKSVELKWNTATETNNYGFEIQRSAVSPQQSDNMWSKIGFVEGNGTTNAPKSYFFTDKSASGKTSYRLKQIDRDGKFEYSQTVEIIAASSPKEFALEQNYPNPFNPTTAIGYQLSANSFTTLKIYDAIGREVATLVNEVKEAGTYSAQFDGAKLSSGIYFARLSSDGKIQIRKLMLMK